MEVELIEFKFSQIKEQYLIFVNGKKINLNDWVLYTHSKDNTDNIQIEITNAYSISKLDVFYIPETVEEITIDKYIDSYAMGNINIESDMMDVPFDKDVFYVYINGTKINANDIDNIDKNSFHINGYTSSISNLCICKYIQSDHIMRELLSYGELWSDGTQTLSSNGYKKLFDKISK